MKLLIQFLCFMSLFISFGSIAHSNETICVLNFERAEHPWSQTFRKLFLNRPHYRYVEQAQPSDFIGCIKDDFSEILMLAHSVEDQSTGSTYFGYFSKLQTDSNPKEESNLSRATDNFKVMYYPLFVKAKSILENKLGSEGMVKLKSLRILSCNPQAAFKTYPELQKLIEDNNIQLDLSPEQSLTSFLKGKRLSTLDKAWVAESLQPFEDQRLNTYFYGYIDLSTAILYRFGDASVLHGKYKINVNGLAIGFGSKWTTLFIKYREVQGLNVGEKKTITVPQVDLTLALWGNMEIFLSRNMSIQWPSEINSWGAAVGVFSTLTIERIY